MVEVFVGGRAFSVYPLRKGGVVRLQRWPLEGAVFLVSAV